MSNQQKIKGLSLKVGPLGENDRLLTLLTLEEGIIRVAVPGARRPKSSLAATSALTFLELQVGGKGSLLKARQIKVIQSFSNGSTAKVVVEKKKRPTSQWASSYLAKIGSQTVTA